LPPPTHIQIGPFNVSVILDDDAANRASISHKTDIDGEWDSRALTLTIRPGMAADKEAETVLHEVLHGLTFTTGLVHDIPDDEEGVVTRLAPALLDTLRRNPKLVAYLLNG